MLCILPYWCTYLLFSQAFLGAILDSLLYLLNDGLSRLTNVRKLQSTQQDGEFNSIWPICSCAVGVGRDLRKAVTWGLVGGRQLEWWKKGGSYQVFVLNSWITFVNVNLRVNEWILFNLGEKKNKPGVEGLMEKEQFLKNEEHVSRSFMRMVRCNAKLVGRTCCASNTKQSELVLWVRVRDSACNAKQRGLVLLGVDAWQYL